MSRKILVFNKVVLPRSHTFVASQSLSVPNYDAIFIGLKKDQDGFELIQGKDISFLSDSTAFPNLSALLLECNISMPKPWAAVLKNKNAELLHAHFGKGGYYCSPISKKLEIPLITTFHGSDITKEDKRSYNKKHRSIVFKNSQKILAISNFVKRKLLEKGCPEEKVIQHYTGVNTQFFKPSSQKSNEPSILFVGRLIEQKGCRFLLEAMTEVHKKIPEAKLFIAGYGKDQETLKNMASEMKNVYFYGPQNIEQVRGLMDQSWITCLPSITMSKGNEEGLSMVCLESQAMGTPIVGFDTGGVGEAVAHESTGVLVPEKNIVKLSEAMIEVLLNNPLRARLSQEGMQRVNDMFNLKTQGEKLEKIYDSLI